MLKKIKSTHHKYFPNPLHYLTYKTINLKLLRPSQKQRCCHIKSAHCLKMAVKRTNNSGCVQQTRQGHVGQTVQTTHHLQGVQSTRSTLAMRGSADQTVSPQG
jgi:hypothetical protein